MSRSTARVLASLTFAVLVLTAAAGSAEGFVVEPPPYTICFNDAQANESALVASLSPAANTTLTVGTPLTLSGSSSAPLTFAVASSPALLSDPDVDHGAGIEQPATGVSATYTFTSTAATAKPGTIYWSASFSSSAFPACAGSAPATYTTPARALTVAPAPVSEPSPPEAPSVAPRAAPIPLRVGLLAAGGFDAKHPLVAYRVHCSASCTGQSSCRAFALKGHQRTPAASVLDLPSTPVSISAPGGEQRITHRYEGTALRALRRITHAGRKLALHCELTAREAPGATAVQSAAWLTA